MAKAAKGDQGPGANRVMAIFVPPRSIPGGFDLVPGGRHQNGQTMFIGMKQHEEQIVVGKVFGKKMWFGYDGKEIETGMNFTVLVSNRINAFKWVECVKNIPNGAVKGGFHQKGEQMYIGRFMVDKQLTSGKVSDGEGCWVSYGGKEHFQSKFECLCFR